MKRQRDASGGARRHRDASAERGGHLGALALALVVTAALVLVFALSSTVRPAVGSDGPGGAPPAATVPARGAGPTCVNVWMGGNPSAPNACRPAPGH